MNFPSAVSRGVFAGGKGTMATRLVWPGKCGLIAKYKSQLGSWIFCIAHCEYFNCYAKIMRGA